MNGRRNNWIVADYDLSGIFGAVVLLDNGSSASEKVLHETGLETMAAQMVD